MRKEKNIENKQINNKKIEETKKKITFVVANERTMPLLNYFSVHSIFYCISNIHNDVDDGKTKNYHNAMHRNFRAIRLIDNNKKIVWLVIVLFAYNIYKSNVVSMNSL